MLSLLTLLVSIAKDHRLGGPIPSSRCNPGYAKIHREAKHNEAPSCEGHYAQSVNNAIHEVGTLGHFVYISRMRMEGGGRGLLYGNQQVSRDVKKELRNFEISAQSGHR